jgi:chorismate mutase-like protein
MNIEDWRAEIDIVDEKIINLLNRRAELVAKIGELKHLYGLPIYDPIREGAVLSHICKANKGPLDNNTLELLFKQIIYQSKLIESRQIEDLVTN